MQFGYGLNYLIGLENAVIVDVEATAGHLFAADHKYASDCRRFLQCLPFSSDRIIAATGFGRLPMGSPRRRDAVSLAPYSPPVSGPQTQSRCKHSCPSRRPVGQCTSSPAVRADCPSRRRRKALLALLRVEVIEADLNLKYELLGTNLNVYFAELTWPISVLGYVANRLFVCRSLLIRNARTVSGSSREVVLLVYSAPSGRWRSAASTSPYFP